MPPKRRPKTKSAQPFVHPAHEQEADVAPDLTLDEARDRIAELEEQIRVMTLQINQSINNVTLNQTHDPSKSRSVSVTDSPRGKRTRKGSSSILKKDQNVGSGCSCSGDCGSKRCGCVKKNKACGETCKCTDSCKNQVDGPNDNDERENDEDKENEKENVQAPKKETKKKAEKNTDTPVNRVTRNRRAQMIVDEDSSSQETPVGPPKPRSLFDTPGSGPENRSSSSETSPALEEKIINPMKPKHQLLRSPPDRNIGTLNNSGRLDVATKSRSASPNVSSTNAVVSDKESDSSMVESFKVELPSPSSNPMQPKHKLIRSPLAGSSIAENTRSKSPNFTNNTSVFHDDDVFLPIPKPDSSQSNVSPPPPPDIFKEKVDWDQHQAELVHCRKCKRTFFAHRVEIHEKSCIKI